MWVAGPRSKSPLTVLPLSLQTGAVWWAATCCAKKPSMNWTGAKDHMLGRWCEGREIAAALVYLRHLLTNTTQNVSHFPLIKKKKKTSVDGSGWSGPLEPDRGGLTRYVIGKGLDLSTCSYMSI